ncbi:MAG: hypothetical protein VX733_03530, partial [Candidatus Latescibacterota bacterium]|nr:hypothetical protein [Candidatus Latescibacterota bacterium]
ESLSPRWGTGTEFRMLRSDRYKYVAFRDCDDLAFDLDADPNEQTNLLLHADGDLRETLEQMRQDVLDGFDFGAVEELRSRQQIELRERFPARISPQTDNQIARGDGALVEADTPLRTAHVITDDLARDLDT